MSSEPLMILNGLNAELLEHLYLRYLDDPESVEESWSSFFQSIDSAPSGNGMLRMTPQLKISRSELRMITDPAMKVFALVQSYRRNGHLAARIDPLDLRQLNRNYLSLSQNGLDDIDPETPFTVMFGGRELTEPLSRTIDRLESIYCKSIGVEFFYLKDESRRHWLIEQFEAPENRIKISKEIQKLIYRKIYSAEYFERFIAEKFPGKKRFSLEGGETLIAGLQTIVELSGRFKIHDIVIGMAHRGRLNVLYNICGKDPGAIFAEFTENITEEMRDGDVKYHLGFSNDITTLTNNPVHLSLSFNPSHLEVVNPVILGSVRARQTHECDKERKQYLPVLVHGDAAFAGQGINYECLNMSNLAGYTVGGSLHIIINNQIGFTTDPSDARSTMYASDLAKILQVPIFHVNGDDPEACYRALYLAMHWHQKFGTDIFIDLVCYRRLGHNETDEPAFTQPLLYQKIKEHPTTVEIYEKKLIAEGVDPAELEAIRTEIQSQLNDALERSKTITAKYETLGGLWKGFQRELDRHPVDTKIDETRLRFLSERLTTLPGDFNANSKISRLLETRHRMVFDDDGKIDWGTGESLAYASLLTEGIPIRLSGQDVRRGTFSHRHAMLFDEQNGEGFVPLNHIQSDQATIEITNSLLSEEAVLGFEFGYSLVDPRILVIWEAQFGDFANGAQVIIDQFITSCETKWNRMSGLVMFLPHGYEGQGPEHSSGRLERYLQLCSQNNIQVANPTTPAQVFHLLRRQMKQNFRKPLIVMTPKSLLRHKEATSAVSDFTDGRFREVIDDPFAQQRPERIKRLLFCNGKIYYDLLEKQRELAREDVAVVRIEQLYPFPALEVEEILSKYGSATEIGWVQEEPRNQGAFTFIEFHFRKIMGLESEMLYFGRTASSSPATGYLKVHKKEQESIVKDCFAD